MTAKPKSLKYEQAVRRNLVEFLRVVRHARSERKGKPTLIELRIRLGIRKNDPYWDELLRDFCQEQGGVPR
jgi:hypothetical protein